MVLVKLALPLLPVHGRTGHKESLNIAIKAQIRNFIASVIYTFILRIKKKRSPWRQSFLLSAFPYKFPFFCVPVLVVMFGISVCGVVEDLLTLWTSGKATGI